MKTIKFGVFKIEKMPELKIEDIIKVYVGKPNTCMCGCAGKYSYSSMNKLQGEINRGYAVTEEDLNDKEVKRVLAKVIKNAEMGIEVIEDKDAYIFSLTLGNKQYSIYTV